MSRPDWGALQQEYIAEYTRSGISPVAWCEARGLNYATARRYIKKTPKNAQTEMCKTAQKSAQKKSAQTAQKRNEKSQEKKPVFDAGLNEGDAEEFSFCPDEFGISDQQAKFAMLVAQGKKPTCKGIWEHPGINQGYFAPTYPQIRDIFYPTVEEVAADWGLNVKINEGNKEVHFYYGRQYRGTTICRSMEKPQTIVGFKIGNALVDELDILPKEKARTAWRKIIARMRYKIDGLRNGIDVTTTPEGFKFVYEQFVKAVREKTELASLYGLVQASTFDNEKNLPADYIPSLLESYPPELIKAYLRGQFTNLTSGTVYLILPSN
ncbi:terminase large subunit domain-containing protein, partial [Escherichia coli]|uniref:terminase large subunit domain-containing protein n=1 Tax=Escherichia coli TaxID=562 RepID=UPI002034BB5C